MHDSGRAAAKKFLLASAVALTLAAAVANADELVSKSYQIAAQPVSTALRAFAAQSDMQLIFSEEDVGQARTVGVQGDLGPREALKTILRGTDLEFEFTTNNVVVVRKADARAVSRTAGLRRSGDGSLLLAESASSTAEGEADTNRTLAEVIVTAQKREERLQDVPVPVAVISGEVLTQTNQLRLQDYYHRIPGLNIQLGGDTKTAELAIRGITNGSGGPPKVGVVIDDVPFGSSTGYGFHGQPDIDPGDIAQIEVLRGPQGTLYGADSLGGLLKFVTIDPSTEKVTGRFQAGTSSTRHGTGDGYNFRGSINVPVSDTMAVRASAFKDQEPGYIDNIQTGERGINQRNSEGGRLALLWKPSEDLSLKLGAIYQQASRDGPDEASKAPGFADLQLRAMPNTYTFDTKTLAYSAALNAKIGAVDLVSLTGFNTDTSSSVGDLWRAAGGYWSDCAGGPVSAGCGLAVYYHTGANGAEERLHTHAQRLSQELRASMPLGDQVTWMLGGYYTNEKGTFGPATFFGTDTATGNPIKSFFFTETAVKYEEYAAFTNLQYNITDRFDVQAGGRLGRVTQTANISRGGPAAPDNYNPVNVPDLHSKETPFTYLVTPRFRISPDLMVYTRFTSGYRPGGANLTCGGSAPCQFESEKTKNYEIGVKGDFLDHALSFDASAYHIDWTNIQVGLANGIIGYTANAGLAKSQGLELSVDVRPFDGLSVAAWVAWNDAKFKKTFPGGIIAGDRLPFSARVSGNLSIDEEFVVSGPLSAFVGGSLSYVGDRLGGVQYTLVPRDKFPSYVQTDLHAGVKYETWTATAFVNNVTDKRAILAGGLDYQYQYPDSPTYTFTVPRTIGLNVAKTFD